MFTVQNYYDNNINNSNNDSSSSSSSCGCGCCCCYYTNNYIYDNNNYHNNDDNDKEISKITWFSGCGAWHIFVIIYHIKLTIPYVSSSCQEIFSLSHSCPPGILVKGHSGCTFSAFPVQQFTNTISYIDFLQM